MDAMRNQLIQAGWGLIAVALVAIASPLVTRADEPAHAKPPAGDAPGIFARRCESCHGATKRKGGFRLDNRADALQGGDSGPSIVPGQPDESLLLDRLVDPDPDLRMPPEGPALTNVEIEQVRQWIAEGAVWNDDGSTPARTVSNHWAFRAPDQPDLPAVQHVGWIRNPIDTFILSRLEQEHVETSPEADRATLIRRLSIDLLGRPPTPEEVAAFASDPSPNAYERLVDRLLASPRFGERWARHWLDLARYADSDGYEKDTGRPYAYRYRDWVISAINADLPFDRFSIEQLAGDLIPGATLDQKAATGFHRNTLTNKEGGVDKEEFRVAAVVDRTNTTGTVWMGLTLSCAQCHTHKYDPITQREYFGIYAFFNGSDEIDLPAPLPGQEKATLPTLAEHDGGRVTHLLAKGDFLRPGEAVEPGTPAVLPPLPTSAPTRLDLAEWLFAPDQPLTSRVAVNRVWSHLFGRGLVATMDDLGTRGEPPSHPELLDWLAVEFRESGWSRKALVRLIVTSATYRQSSRPRPELKQRDPYNTWLSHQNRFRPEAEIMRDLALAASGLLAERIGGPSVRPPQPPGISELTYANSAKWVDSQGPDRYRRGLYTWFQRTSPYPMLLTFDAPDGNICVVRRERSNTPLQALTLLNDPVFVECARALGYKLAHMTDLNAECRIDHAFMVTLGRAPEPEEAVELAALRDRFQTHFESNPTSTHLFMSDDTANAEQASWTALARTLLNLDEFLNRP